MISPLAKGDYEDLLAAKLPATLEDFDRLNTIALRLTNGAETTAANFPRVGWAGDIPFFQPTCAALAWYLANVPRAGFSVETQDFCWYYALAHARTHGAFDGLTSPGAIRVCVEKWIATLPVTASEVARACLYAARGFDDAIAGKTPAKEAEDAKKTDEDRRAETLNVLEDKVTQAAALTGIPPKTLSEETPSRLDAMIARVEKLHGREYGVDKTQLQADYDMTLRKIKRRLLDEVNK